MLLLSIRQKKKKKKTCMITSRENKEGCKLRIKIAHLKLQIIIKLCTNK